VSAFGPTNLAASSDSSGPTEASWLDDVGGLKLSLKPSGVEADR